MPVEFAATKNVILAQKVGEQLVKLHYETAALQVKFADGTDLETKAGALEAGAAKKSVMYVDTLPETVPEDLCEGGLLVIG